MRKKTQIALGLLLIIGFIAFTSNQLFSPVISPPEDDDTNDPGNGMGPGGDPITNPPPDEPNDDPPQDDPPENDPPLPPGVSPD